MSEVGFSLPDVGEAEVELVEWRVKPGDLVAEDDSILVIRLDGSLAEIGSPAAGTIRALLAQPGQTLRSGESLATIMEGEADVSASDQAPKPEVGRVYAGKVVVVTEFSALVKFFNDLDGLVTKDQIKPKKSVDPRVELAIGQSVKVRLVAFDKLGKAILTMVGIDQPAERTESHGVADLSTLAANVEDELWKRLHGTPVGPDGVDLSLGEAIFKPFRDPQLQVAIDRAKAIESESQRLSELRAVYEETLAQTWGGHVTQAQKAFEALIKSHAATEAKTRNERRERDLQIQRAKRAELDRIDAGLATERDRINADIEKIGRQAEERRAAAEKTYKAFLEQSSSAIVVVWNRIGKALEIELPRLEPPSAPPAVATGEPSYLTAKQAAEALPAFVPLGEEPLIRRYLFWIAVAALVLGWMFTSTFGGGLIIAIFVGVTLVIARVLMRQSAASKFSAFVAATKRAQATQWLEYTAIARACSEEIAQKTTTPRQALKAAEATAAEAISAAHAEADSAFSKSSEQELAALGEARAVFDSRLANSFGVWRADKETCAKLVQRLDEAIKGTISGLPSVCAPLEEARGAALPTSFRERLVFRVGEYEPSSLADLPPHIARLSGDGDRSKPVSLTVRVPTFWDLNAKRALIYSEAVAGDASGGKIASSVMARMLALLPPGKVNFTLFDPVGLGNNFSGIVELGDFSGQLINGRVWSEKEHLRQKLKDLIEHIETVTQKYLRTKHADIEDYNRGAEDMAEAYRVLVLVDFPEGVDEELGRDLKRVMQNGPRCGVFTFIHYAAHAKPAYGVDPNSLRPFSSELAAASGTPVCRFKLRAEDSSSSAVHLDAALDDAALKDLVQGHGKQSEKAIKGSITYERLLKVAGIKDGVFWDKADADKVLAVPVGPTPLREPQFISFGEGKNAGYHGLIVGRTGSGKSNLMNVFITTAARLYSPDDLQLYLIDFKKGVEFKEYALVGLPHARVIAIESEREFGLSVLEGLDREMTIRGDMFREVSAVKLSEFNAKRSHEARLPRIVLVVDEFQELFARQDKIARESTILIDRLVRQGRNFGISVMLGTQSLSNAGLERSTMDQMAVRIALQCSEEDSKRILSDGNTAARLLSRPGEAIYNHSAGSLEDNSLFQVANLTEKDRREQLELIAQAAKERNWQGPAPRIFEGNAPSVLANCKPLLHGDPPEAKLSSPIKLWVGELASLKDFSPLELKRQVGRNLLVVTRDEPEGVGVVLASLLSIAAQTRPDACSFKIVDLTSVDESWADHPEAFAEAVPHKVEVLGRHDLDVLVELAAEVARRVENPDEARSRSPTIVFTILGLHRARQLREQEGGGSRFIYRDDEPGKPDLRTCLVQVLKDGPEVGVHVLIWSDAYSNLTKVLDGSELDDLGLRIAGPLAAQESTKLFDDHIASTIEKPNRMVAYDEERVGTLQMITPYAIPPIELIYKIGDHCRELAIGQPAKAKGRTEA
jgi:pyruvate/2-oxoglutarate dehydrogenase complex dihydrolipoamide acyltransferase (E2) component